MPLIEKIESYLNRFGIYATAGGLVWAFMSWAASYITPLSGYGWGAFVYVGFGAACVMMLVLSAVAVAWRYFHPIIPKPSKPGKTETTPSVLPEMARDVLHLLDLGVYQTTLTMLSQLVEKIPEKYDLNYNAPLTKELANGLAYNDALKWLETVRHSICDGSHHASKYESIWLSAESHAERELKETPQNERPTGIDPLVLRDYAIAFRRAVWTASFLRSEKSEIERSVIAKRDVFIERFQLRSKN